MEDKINQDVDGKDTPNDDVKDTAPEYTEEEKVALSKGWKPKDQWEGDEGEWKPAKVFNEIGDLKDKLTSAEKEVKKSNKIISIMKEHHLNVRQAAYDQAMKDLKGARDKALKDEDFAKAEQLRDQIDEVRTKYKEDNVLPADVEKEIRAQESQTPDPAFVEFLDRNQWYKAGGKDEMSAKADALGFAYASADRSLTFKEVITKVEKDIRKLFPEKFETPRNPVNEQGRQNGTSATSKTKVKLSDDELQVAKTFGMTPEQYAKELESYKGR